MKKVCSKCKKEKEISEFGKHKFTKDKLNCHCKKCILETRLNFKLNNPKWDKDYYLSKKDYYRKKSNDRYYDKKDEIIKSQKIYYKNNKEKIKIYYNSWLKLNKEKVNNYNKKRKENPNIKLSCVLRSRISKGLKDFNGIKNKSTLDIIGLNSWEDLRLYIEKFWLEGMSWSNYGLGSNNSTWHIDHLIPLSSAKNQEDIIKLNYYLNLKPMWGSDNIRKGNNF